MPLNAKLRSLDHEIAQLNMTTRDLRTIIGSLEGRVVGLEGGKPVPPCPEGGKAAPDTDVNLPGSDEEKEDAHKEMITAEHIKVKFYIDFS